MKKLFLILGMLLCLITLSASSYATPTRTVRQQQMHEIANLARAAGLAEDGLIIQEAKRLWHEDEGREQDIAIIARVVYWEEGRDIACEADLTDEKIEKLLLVGKTVYNRCNDSRFPDDVYSVVAQPGQYLKGYADGGKYNVPGEVLHIFEDLARRVLDGEPLDCPENVIYADTKRHGTGVYKSFYNAQFGNTTYFCYG